MKFKIARHNVVYGRVASIQDGAYVFSEKQYQWYLPKRFRLIGTEQQVKVGDLVLVSPFNKKKVLVEEIKDIKRSLREERRIHQKVTWKISTFEEELNRWERIRPRKYDKKKVPLVRL